MWIIEQRQRLSDDRCDFFWHYQEDDQEGLPAKCRQFPSWPKAKGFAEARNLQIPPTTLQCRELVCAHVKNGGNKDCKLEWPKAPKAKEAEAGVAEVANEQACGAAAAAPAAASNRSDNNAMVQAVQAMEQPDEVDGGHEEKTHSEILSAEESKPKHTMAMDVADVHRHSDRTEMDEEISKRRRVDAFPESGELEEDSLAAAMASLGIASPRRMFLINQHHDDFNTETQAGAACCTFLSVILVCDWLLEGVPNLVARLMSPSGEPVLRSLLYRASALAKLWEVKKLHVPGYPVDRYIAVEELKMWASGISGAEGRIPGYDHAQEELVRLQERFHKLVLDRVFEGPLVAAVDFLDIDWFSQCKDGADGVRDCGYLFIVQGKTFCVLGLKDVKAVFHYDSHVFDADHLEHSCASLLSSKEAFLQHLTSGRSTVMYAVDHPTAIYKLQKAPDSRLGGQMDGGGQVDTRSQSVVMELLPPSANKSESAQGSTGANGHDRNHVLQAAVLQAAGSPPVAPVASHGANDVPSQPVPVHVVDVGQAVRLRVRKRAHEESVEAAVVKSEKGIVEHGRQVLSKMNIDHGQVFQQSHQFHHCPSPAGHWNKFLTLVGRQELGHEVKVEDIRCVACKELVRKCASCRPTASTGPAVIVQTSSQSPGANSLIVVDSSEDEMDLHAGLAAGATPLTSKKKRGRPPRNSPEFSLEAWIGSERPGMYTCCPPLEFEQPSQSKSGRTRRAKKASDVVDVPVSPRKVSLPLHCNICHSVFGAQRASSNHWILLHEASEKHQIALVSERMKGNSVAMMGQCVQGGQDGEKGSVVPRDGCNGLVFAMMDAAMNLKRMEAVFAIWWASNCISHRDDSTQKIILEKEPSASREASLVLRSTCCARAKAHLLPCGWCLHCNAAMKDRQILSTVSSWAYKIDVVSLLHLSLQGQCTKEHLSHMSKAEYNRFILVPMEALQKASFEQVLHRAQSLFLSRSKAERSPSLQQYIESRLQWIRPSMAGQQGRLAGKVAEDWATSTASSEEQRAGALIASGVLKGHEFARALLLLVVSQAEKARRGLQRTGTSKVAGVPQEVLLEVAYKLGGLVGNQALCREIGLSVRGLPRINFFDETLPTPFCGDFLSSERLTFNVARCIDLCRCEFKRDYMLVFDETAFAASQEMLQGFGPDGRAMVVGGAFPHHLMDVGSDIGPLATQALSVSLKRADCNNAVWQVLMLPRTAKSGNQDSMLKLIGEVVQSCVEANHRLPPISLACDGHGSHRRILSLLSGLEHPCRLPSNVPFFSECKRGTAVAIPCWPFRTCFFGPHPIFGVLDPEHLQKSLSRCIRAANRMVTFGDFFVSSTCLASNGIPVQPFECVNSMRYKDAVWIMHPVAASRTFDGLGLVFFQMIVSLLVTSWTAQAGFFSPQEIFSNSLVAYYCFLALLMMARSKHGSKYQNNCPALVTLRHCCILAGQAVHRVIHWPEQLHFTLKHCQEDQLEHFFSALKRPYHGTPTFKDLIVFPASSHQTEIESFPNCSRAAKKNVFARLSRNEVVALGNESLDAACQFLSMALVQTPPSEMRAQLQSWYEQDGQHLLFRQTDHDDESMESAEARGGQEDEDHDDEIDEMDEKVENDDRDMMHAEALDEEDQQVRSTVEHAERHLEAAKEIKAMNDLMEQGGPAEPANLQSRFDAVAEFSDEDGEKLARDDATMVVSLGELVLRPSRTLVGLLKESGLACDMDGGPEADSESLCRVRAWKLVPAMVQFMIEARCSEKCLSLTQLSGNTAQLNDWNKMQHELACARRAFVSNTSRQSRSALWMGFQKRIQQEFQQPDMPSGEQDVEIAKKFYPSCVKHDGQRIFQTLLIRAHRSGGLYVAVVLAIFRGYRKTDKSETKRFGCRITATAMPAEMVTKIHVLVLEAPPEEERRAMANQSDLELWGTPSGATMVLDPHDAEGVVLGQLSSDKLFFTESRELLRVGFSKQTWRSICKVRKDHSSVCPTDSTPDRREYSRVTFTVESFGGQHTYSEKQRSNIITYLQELATLCSRAGFSLLDKDGVVTIKGRSLLFSDLCLRTPSFLLARWKSYFKNSKSRFGACNSFGEYVLVTFRRLLPGKGDDPASSLRAFLFDVDKEALPVLRGA